jgi:uncharacterized protein
LLEIKARLKVEVTTILEKDIFELTSEDLAGFDAIVLAHRAPAGHEEDYSKVAHVMIKLLENIDSRLIVVGGASSLYLDESHEKLLLDGDTNRFTLLSNSFRNGKSKLDL